ncbi:thioredoxin family protein [Desulfosporosinus nitroreducens]|uniref:thioredoxin family protein n=1 Tax=Desulfosporosinus nitroreducens TaxID=2018668 RepID=UPI00207CB19D|nr:thioredoxin domain-containing protein [Desulfosporosinus nitroreducens]MCO1603138.1 thioredoxin domain-containing protein [Desulfosporosinus nitroreducens]
MQLAHAGRFASQQLTGQTALAVSLVKDLPNTSVREMTIEDIRELAEAYAEAAERAKAKVLLLFFNAQDNESLNYRTALEEINQKDSLDCKIVSVDTATKKNLAEKYAVRSIPTVLVLDKGKEIKRLKGLEVLTSTEWKTILTN